MFIAKIYSCIQVQGAIAVITNSHRTFVVMKTCYYELLEVSETASDSDLKRAYRKKALQLHPDKNPDDVDGATQRFALVRAAYEVLSDPQERSWYDSHKNQILRDDDDYDYEEEAIPTIPSISVEELMRYFNPALYTVVDDSQAGFYNVTERLFERLAAEEIRHAKLQGLKEYELFKDDAPNVNVIDTSMLKFPRFGNSGSDYVTHLRGFYNEWSSFQTAKSFAWKDSYRYSSAPDRRTKRLMEKENKKLRDSARKEYNETVRSYVQFIKKRDPRVKKGVSEFEKLRKKKQQEELERQAKEQRLRELREMAKNKFDVQDWQKLDIDELEEVERILEEDFKSSSDSEFDEYAAPEADDYYDCIVCNKQFKTKRQFEMHELSNKHKKAVKRLQWSMRKEGIELGIDKMDGESEISEDNDDFMTADEDESEQDEAEESDNADVTLEKVKSIDSVQPVEVEVDNDIDSEDIDASLAELAAHIEKGAKIVDSDDDWDAKPKKKKKEKKEKKDKKETTPQPTEQCSVCSETFPSRNKLFQHVNSTGHALAPPKKKKNKKRK